MAKARPIPKGYQTVTPGVTIKGADAFITFCKKAFGAKVVTRMAGPDGSVMHAELLIGTSHLMIGEEMPSWGATSAATLGGTPVNLYVYVPNVDAAFKKVVNAGAKVVMPVTNQFWGDRMGAVTDPFGNKWTIATHVEDVSPREMKKRGEAWARQSQKPADKGQK
jgi:PhnB protein